MQKLVVQCLSFLSVLTFMLFPSFARAQMTCDQITLKVMRFDLFPDVVKVGGPTCRFTTTELSGKQTSPGIVDIYWVKATNVTSADFDKMLSDWHAKYQNECGAKTHLGQRAAFCPGFDANDPNGNPTDNELLILRGSTLLTIEFHNWTYLGTENMAIQLSKDAFGSAPERAPLVKPE